MSVRYAWWGPPWQIGMVATSALLVTVAQIGVQQSRPAPGSLSQLAAILLGLAAMGLMFWSFWLLGRGMQRLSAVVGADAIRVMPGAAHNLGGAAWLWCALAVAVVASAGTAFVFDRDGGGQGARIGLTFVWLACFGGALPTSLKQVLAVPRADDRSWFAVLPFIPLVAAWQVPGGWGVLLLAVLVAAGVCWQFRMLIRRLERAPTAGESRPSWRRFSLPAVKTGPVVRALGRSGSILLGMLLITTAPWASYTHDMPFRLYILLMIFYGNDQRGMELAGLRLRWLAGLSRLQLIPLVLRQAMLPAATDIAVAALAGAVLHALGWAEAKELSVLWGQFVLMRMAFMLSSLCWIDTRSGWRPGRYLAYLCVFCVIALLDWLWGAEPAVTALLIHALAAVSVGAMRWRRLAF
ncbi:MAG: hypothetical protein REI94_15630 [Moraxellaceae bacterium]|nr:hypothetical protein [Moraxellaceae bacterium]